MELHAEAARQERRNVPLAQADHRPVGEFMAAEHGFMPRRRTCACQRPLSFLIAAMVISNFDCRSRVLSRLELTAKPLH